MGVPLGEGVGVLAGVFVGGGEETGEGVAVSWLMPERQRLSTQ